MEAPLSHILEFSLNTAGEGGVSSVGGLCMEQSQAEVIWGEEAAITLLCAL